MTNWDLMSDDDLDNAYSSKPLQKGDCKQCERRGTLQPVTPGATNVQCVWCWAIFTPAGELVWTSQSGFVNHQRIKKG